MTEIDLQGIKVLLTGCDGGLGQAMLRCLTEAGAEVILTDLVKPEKSIAYLESLNKDPRWYAANLAGADEVGRLFKRISADTGAVDILINNAGIRRDALLVKMTEAQWDEVMDTDLKAVFLCTREAVKLMLRKKVRTGRVITISSLAGITGNPGQTNYAAAKAGVIAMTRTWAREYGNRGLRFNAVAPGLIESPMTDTLPEQEVGRLKEAVPPVSWENPPTLPIRCSSSAPLFPITSTARSFAWMEAP